MSIFIKFENVKFFCKNFNDIYKKNQGPLTKPGLRILVHR